MKFALLSLSRAELFAIRDRERSEYISYTHAIYLDRESVEPR